MKNNVLFFNYLPAVSSHKSFRELPAFCPAGCKDRGVSFPDKSFLKVFVKTATGKPVKVRWLLHTSLASAAFHDWKRKRKKVLEISGREEKRWFFNVRKSKWSLIIAGKNSAIDASRRYPIASRILSERINEASPTLTWLLQNAYFWWKQRFQCGKQRELPKPAPGRDLFYREDGKTGKESFEKAVFFGT